MAATNVPTRSFTHEGGPACQTSAEQELRRAVMSCLLWEGQFYESGESIADRICNLVPQVPTNKVYQIAYESAIDMNLRHVPLLLARELAKIPEGRQVLAHLLSTVIRRPDSITEFMSLYWQDGKRPIANQVKKGLAEALKKFDEYSLAKYNRDTPIKLRDVMFMVRPKPDTPEQEKLFSKLANNELETPDTWEVSLSSGADPKETFTRLIEEGKLGYLALLRNLRNMVEANVDPKLVREAILARKNGADRVLPFRFVAAAKHAPAFAPELDAALLHSLEALPQFEGETVLLVDVSGSMFMHKISPKSILDRFDAAGTLASIFPGRARVFSFSREVVEVPQRAGMAGVEAICNSQSHSGTLLGQAVGHINENVPHDRLIVITDEQSHDRVPAPVAEKAYMINVASYQNGVGYGQYTHINGFSENVLRYISELER